MAKMGPKGGQLETKTSQELGEGEEEGPQGSSYYFAFFMVSPLPWSLLHLPQPVQVSFWSVAALRGLLPTGLSLSSPHTLYPTSALLLILF